MNKNYTLVNNIFSIFENFVEKMALYFGRYFVYNRAKLFTTMF